MNAKDPAPSIWLTENAGRKIAKGTVDRVMIAAAAVELLDETGLDGLTMRDLGERLGVSAMACYAHVRHKDDVLELAQDHIMGALDTSVGPWAEVLRSVGSDYRDLLIEHPWLPQLAGRFLNAGPNVRALSARAGAALTDGGLDERWAPLALSAVFTLAHGYGAVEAAWRSRLGERAALDELTGRLARLAPDDPVLAHRAAAGTEASSGSEWNFALSCLLSGIRDLTENR